MPDISNMPARPLFLFLCLYTVISAGLTFKYYLNARPSSENGSPYGFTATREGPSGPVREENAEQAGADLFQRAEEHFFSRRYNTSLALFLRVLESNPEHGKAHNYCGDIYLIQKNLEKASYHFRIAAEIGPEKHKAEFRLGQIAYLRKDGQAASDHLRQSLELSPDFAPSIFYQGLVAWKLNENREEAALKWEKYISLRPQDPHRVAIQQAIDHLRSDADEKAEEEAGPPLDLDRLLKNADPTSGPPSGLPQRPLNNSKETENSATDSKGKDSAGTSDESSANGPGGRQGPKDAERASPGNDSQEAPAGREKDTAGEKAERDSSGDGQKTEEESPASRALRETTDQEDQLAETVALASSLKDHPERLSTILDLSRIYSEQGETTRSLTLLQEAIKHNDSPALSERLAADLASLGRTTEARKVLRRQMERDDLSRKDRASMAFRLAQISEPELGEPSRSDAPESTEAKKEDGPPASGEDSGPANDPNLTDTPNGPTAQNQTETSDQPTAQNQTDTTSKRPGGMESQAKQSSSEDYEQAMQTLADGAYRHLSPSNRKKYHLLEARKAYREGDASRAYGQALQILKEDPTDRKGLILAAAISRKSNTETSFAVYEERILSLYGDDPDMMLALAELYRGQEPAEYAKRLESLNEKHPDHPGVGLAMFEQWKGKDPARALQILEKRIHSHPNHLPLLNAYISFQIQQGNRSEEFLKLLRRARDVEKTRPGSFPDMEKWMDDLPPGTMESKQSPSPESKTNKNNP